MKKFESRKLHDHIELVKETEYSFMLVFRNRKGEQIGDITIYTETNTHKVKSISVAFRREIPLKIVDPSWNGTIIYVNDSD